MVHLKRHSLCGGCSCWCRCLIWEWCLKCLKPQELSLIACQRSHIDFSLCRLIFPFLYLDDIFTFHTFNHFFLVCAVFTFVFTPPLLNALPLTLCTSSFLSHSPVSADTVPSGFLTPGVGSVFFARPSEGEGKREDEPCASVSAGNDHWGFWREVYTCRGT